jgi:AraC-like DNA-binding protein
MGNLNGNHVDDSHLMFFKPDSELNGHTSASYSWTSLIVPLHWVATMRQALHNARALNFQSECPWLRPDPGRNADLWLAVGAMITPATMQTDRAAGDKWLLTDLQNALGAALSSLDLAIDKTGYGARAHFSIARRTDRYMRERLTDPVCIDEVCVAMRVSRRYLEYAFADAFGTSPSRYFRLLRLVEVRRRPRTLGNATTVTEEANRLGFSHLSLFSVQYRKLFGQSPSSILASAAR